ncbi:MAG: glycosyltransferase family 4 protein [Candidatus Eisenbacteria bacterium]|nr:glycosyltransferase family 4 protein [Candidatus Eisenbacteria bacterium]
MKVLAVNKYYFVKGGAEKYFFELGRILERYGNDVIPFAMRHELNEPTPYERFFVSTELFDDRGSVRDRLRAAARVLYSVEARRSIEALVDATRPDVAHLHNIAHQLSPSILYGLRDRGVPVVQTLHDYKLICPNYQMLIRGATCERCATWRYYNAVLNRCMRDSLAASALVAAESYLHKMLGTYTRGVDLFIAPSAQLRKKMIAHGVDGQKIVHVPNAIALDSYAPSYASEGYAAYVGRLSSGKGLGTLLSALKLAPSVAFRIAGSGPLEHELRMAASAQAIDNVEFVGYKRGSELADLVKGALFVVVPSECYENSPMAIHESFAHGKAVVGSRIGGIPELISEGETGLLFEPGDSEGLAGCLRRLWDDPAWALDMGRAARQRAESEYGQELHYERVMAVYERVTS